MRGWMEHHCARPCCLQSVLFPQGEEAKSYAPSPWTHSAGCETTSIARLWAASLCQGVGGGGGCGVLGVKSAAHSHALEAMRGNLRWMLEVDSRHSKHEIVPSWHRLP